MSLHKEGLVQMPRESMERLLKGRFIQRTKRCNLCPYWSAGRFPCFVMFWFLITPSADGQQSHIFSGKFTQQELAAASGMPQTKSSFFKAGPALHTILVDIQIQMVPRSSSSIYSCGGSSCTHTHILSIHQIYSYRSASTGDFACPGTATTPSFHFCFHGKVMISKAM